MNTLKLLRPLSWWLVLIMSTTAGVAGAQTMRTNLMLPDSDPYCTADGYPNLGRVGGAAPPDCPLIGPLTIPRQDGQSEADVVVDWVLVELHAIPQEQDGTSNLSEANAGTVIARKPALLLNNGRVVDAEEFTDNPRTRTQIQSCNGVEPNEENCPSVIFDDTNIDEGNDLYIVLRHRHHLDVISSSAVTEATNGHYEYDFTEETISRTRGFTGSQTLPSTPQMIAGDVDNNRNVDISDFTDSERGFSTQFGRSTGGYFSGDYDMNGNVDISDFTALFSPNFGRVGTVAPLISDN
ncbi:MAG: hypothetical protein GDA45_01040 [Chromatiales bacterium]|nr:hypothetical protein [Chromatiales bacterium]